MTDAVDIRLAILGCGAVTEHLYLPALGDLSGTRITLLVDTDAVRRKRLASKFHVEHNRVEVDQCCDLFDAAIIALPNFLHASSSINLLSRGKAVLVESPMALSVAECDAMIRAAEQNNALLGVGLTRRFLWAHRFAFALIKSAALGQIESFDVRNGSTYDWPITSDSSFRKGTAGGGALIDTGANTLDCMLHWLGDFSEVEYFDDAAGGVEANCLLNLSLQNGACGVVELSRTRRLRNTATVRCERGAIEIGLDTNYCKLSFADPSYVLDDQIGNLNQPGKSQDDLELVRAQVRDFVAAMRAKGKPEMDGQAARSTVRLIETCYRRRKPLSFGWAYK